MRAEETRERQCWGCRAEVATLVCPRCQAIQPLSGEPDLFAVLGLPRRLMIDPADLERRYHETSRVVHPDRFQTASPRRRKLSLDAGAAVHRADATPGEPHAPGPERPAPP